MLGRPLRSKSVPLLALLLSVSACAEEDFATPPSGGSELTERPGAVTESEPARDEAATEGDVRSDAAAELGLYRADFCQDEAFIVTEGITREEALENCGLNYASNPGVGIRCSWNGEVLADRCDAAGGPTPEAPAPETSAPRSAEDQAIADCWSACVSGAFPGLVACNDAGGGDICQTQFNDAVYACAEGCYDVPAAAAPDEAASVDAPAEPSTGDIYRGFRCDNSPFIETVGISREEALANCELNAAGVSGGVFCTFNDEVIFANCPTTVGYTGPAEALEGPAACEGWEQVNLDRVADAIDETYWSAEAMNCDGPSFRRFDARYGLWVGLVSCGDAGYRFFLSEVAEGPYLPATDSSGHGQDFCELVDPSFRIEHGDDMTSGGCTECSIGFNYSFVSGEVFVRGFYGERFVRTEAISWGPYQSSVIRCATGPLACEAPSRPL